MNPEDKQDQEDFALLSLYADSKQPRPVLRDELMQRIANPSTVDVSQKRKLSLRECLAWTMALALAGGCVYLWNLYSGERESVVSLQGELIESRKLARLEIDSLNATIDEYKNGVAVVIWDQQEQSGILKLQKMPNLKQDQDYQLWVVDPNYENPVDSGVISIDENGFARVEFQPREEIRDARKFAISVERKGGVPVPGGPIVLLSP